jgi:Protein of unknown function (DUF2510)
MSENPAAPPFTAPAGWYPDPQAHGQRYWDGRAWTHNFAPFADPPGSRARAGDWIGGVLLSLLVPLIGLIAGAVYISKGGTKKQVGVMCVCLSGAMFLIWFVMLSAEGSAGY